MLRRRCKPTRPARVCAGAVLAVALAGALAVTGTATAGTLLGGYRTPGCEDAPLWRIGYRLYWTDDQGRSTSRAALNSVYAQTETFAQTVGAASRCAVRVQVDLYDEGANSWVATADKGTYPSDTDTFARSGDFDALFARFPKTGIEDYAGVAFSPGHKRPRAKFPAPSYATGFTDQPLFFEANAMVLWHEWMHLVVDFYEHPRQSWPVDDVHGACSHGYVPAGASCRDEWQYFSDLMTGRVMEAGRPRGLLPNEWAHFGTPRDPRNQRPWMVLRVNAGGGTVSWTKGLPKVILTYSNRRTGRRMYRKDVTRGVQTLLPPMPAGRYRVCLTAPVSHRYARGRICRNYTVKRNSSQARRWSR